MQQALVAGIIRALHPPLDSQKLFHGGMPSALEAVEAAINEGYDYGVEVDVVQFYASVRPTGLAELLRPLPSAVVDHVVWDTGVRRDPDSDFVTPVSLDDPSLNGLVGLAPGAVTSPIVGEKVISQLLSGRRGTKLIAYADNIFVLGRVRGAVLSCLEHLRETAEKLPTGALRLRIGDIHHLRNISGGAKIPEQFSFLHHVGEIVLGEAPDDPVNVCWSPDERKLDQYRLSERNGRLTLDQIDKIERKVSQWRRAYPSWPDGDIWELRYLAELAALRFYEAGEPLHKSHAAHQAVLSYFAMDGVMDFTEFLPDALDARERKRRNELVTATRQRLQTISARLSGKRDWLTHSLPDAS